MGAKCSIDTLCDQPTAAQEDLWVDSTLYIGPLRTEGEDIKRFEARKEKKIMNLQVQADYIDKKGVLNAIGGGQMPSDLEERFKSPGLRAKIVKKGGFIIWESPSKKCIGSNLEAAKFQQYKGPKTRAPRWRHEFGAPSFEKLEKKSNSGQVMYTDAPQHQTHKKVPVRKPQPRPQPVVCPLDYLSYRKQEPIESCFSLRMNVY